MICIHCGQPIQPEEYDDQVVLNFIHLAGYFGCGRDVDNWPEMGEPLWDCVAEVWPAPTGEAVHVGDVFPTRLW